MRSLFVVLALLVAGTNVALAQPRGGAGAAPELGRTEDRNAIAAFTNACCGASSADCTGDVIRKAMEEMGLQEPGQARPAQGAVPSR